MAATLGVAPAAAPSTSSAHPLASQHPLGPAFGARFRPAKAREIVSGMLRGRLAGMAYNADTMSAITRELADEIKQRIKAEGWPRYKFAVQVFIGEQRGEGCRMASRCFWDNETDHYAFETFQNETIVAAAAVFATYTY